MRGFLESMERTKMKWRKGAFCALIVLATFIFPAVLKLESSVWDWTEGEGASGGVGGRSFSAPSMLAETARSSTPGMLPNPGLSSPAVGYGRSTFWSGLACGVAGWLIGNLFSGGWAYAGPMRFGGAPWLLELLITGVLVYFGYRYFVRRRGRQSIHYEENLGGNYPQHGAPYYGGSRQPHISELTEVERGLEEIRRFDPSFNKERFLKNVEDLFFRIQAAWMNRSLDGVEDMLTTEMGDYFRGEFARMKHENTINRLENIAVREVESAEVWQESGRDFITVLFTVSLLDYTVDERTGKLVNGDRLNPVKLQEFCTFTRGTGDRLWRLAGINRPGEPSPD